MIVAIKSGKKKAKPQPLYRLKNGSVSYGVINFGEAMPFTVSSIIDKALARNKFAQFRPWASFHFQQLFVEGNGFDHVKKLRKFLDNFIANLYNVYCKYVNLQKDRKVDTMEKSYKRGNKSSKKLHRAVGVIFDRFFNVLNLQSFSKAYLEKANIPKTADLMLDDFDVIDERALYLIFFNISKVLSSTLEQWLLQKWGADVESCINIPAYESRAQYSGPTQKKMYEFCGFLCCRLERVNRNNPKVVKQYLEKFIEHNRFQEGSAQENASASLSAGLPKSSPMQNIYMRSAFFNLIMYLNHIFVSIMTTKFMVLYNNNNPVEIVKAQMFASKIVWRLLEACIPSTAPVHRLESKSENPCITVLQNIINLFTSSCSKDRFKVCIHAAHIQHGASVRAIHAVNTDSNDIDKSDPCNRQGKNYEELTTSGKKSCRKERSINKLTETDNSISDSSSIDSCNDEDEDNSDSDEDDDVVSRLYRIDNEEEAIRTMSLR